MEKQKAAQCIELLRHNWRQNENADVREAFRTLHRTEQQNVLRNLIQILDEAQLAYQDKRYDARNEASCKWAYDAIDVFNGFPYI
jgi:hypothetical protein